MLVFTLIACTLLLVTANFAVQRSMLATVFFFLLGFVFIAGGLVLPFSPPAMILFLLLLVVLGFHGSLQDRRKRYSVLASSFAATSLATAGFVWRDMSRTEGLKAKYAFEPISARLPARTQLSEAPLLSSEAAIGLDRMEDFMDREHDRPFSRAERRHRALRNLHAGTIASFINSSGFGAGRMQAIYAPSEWNLKTERELSEKDKPVPQPHRRDVSAEESTGGRPESLQASAELEKLHQDSTVDFVNPEGFGYVTESHQVAGFESHAFANPPKPAGDWSIATVDLVGLLLSKKPRVYESKNLPRMDELKNAPTRPLDRFERDGLEKLKGGEDLIVASTVSGARMLGAIRSAKQCLQCHQGNRGDLLGAFTYRLERKGKE
jgi:hypothetical protein